MSHPLLSAKEGERHLLLGNEAIVRGALEAGVNVVTCYPGTPSSEVPDTFYKLKSDRYRFEYSVNEKVALEVGAGAALAGAMTLVTMKHVGVNVAADPLLTMSYTGVPGGLVLLSADDPGCHSSQNEQDNRYYARLASLPCFEPSSAQEAKDMTREALLLARTLQQPVLLRSTTRMSHLRGEVVYGALPDAAPIVPFEKNPGRFVPVPAAARKRHHALAEVLERAREFVEQSAWNHVDTYGDGTKQSRFGVLASGMARAYLADALEGIAATARDGLQIFELGVSWPLPEKKLLHFLQSCDKVLVLEELAPLLEQDIRALAQKHGLTVQIVGKGGSLTIFDEYSVSLVQRALAEFLDTPDTVACLSASSENLPGRPPNLCPGCSHRAVYYAVRKVFGDDAVYSSDIGCYTLGLLPPLRAADFLFCMGSSVSAGSGFAMISDKPVVGFIGDSTFFHSGITGLANAVFNKHNLLLVILDNGTTAMTGHQPNPGMDQNILGEACLHLDIEAFVRACGVTAVAKVHAFNVKSSMKVLEEFKAKSGVRVLIAEEPCVLYARRTLKKAKTQVAEVVTQGADTLQCLTELACPAFVRTDDTVQVDETLCSGCMVCLQISPAFKARKRSV